MITVAVFLLIGIAGAMVVGGWVANEREIEQRHQRHVARHEAAQLASRYSVSIWPEYDYDCPVCRRA